MGTFSPRSAALRAAFVWSEALWSSSAHSALALKATKRHPPRLRQSLTVILHGEMEFEGRAHTKGIHSLVSRLFSGLNHREISRLAEVATYGWRERKRKE